MILGLPFVLANLLPSKKEFRFNLDISVLAQMQVNLILFYSCILYIHITSIT